MSWFYGGILWIGLILLLPFGIGKFDPVYQTVKHSYESILKKDLRAPLMSPDAAQFNASLKNHWKVSPIFAMLEDIFYPVRQWRETPIEAIQLDRDDHILQSQLMSMIRIEKETKVRAMRAYFFAKRKNFKDQALNNDFINKNNQWLSTFNDVIDRKVQLINGTYNNAWVLVSVSVCFFGVLFWLIGFKYAMILTLSLILALFLGSFYKSIDHAIPFHWYLILVGLILGFKAKSHCRCLISFSCISMMLLLLATSSIVGFLLGCFAMQLIMTYPAIKKASYWVFLFHPLGACYVLSKGLGRNKNACIFGGALAALIAMNALGLHGLLTSPIAYLGDIGIAVNSVVLMMISGAFLSEIQVSYYKKMGLASGIILILTINLLLKSPLFGWVFNFLWNPIVQWGSVIVLCALLIQPRRPQSIIQTVEDKRKHAHD
jgi:hypothetical protein